MFRWLMVLTMNTLIVASGSAAAPVSLGPGRQPRVVSDGGDNVAVVFGRTGQVLIARSADGGTTFDKAAVVADLKTLALGMRRGPRAVMTGKSVVVTAIGSDDGDAAHNDIHAWISTDDGKTFRPAAKPLNALRGSAREGLHGLDANRAGLVACVWLDLRNLTPGKPGTELWMALSRDGGGTWEPDKLLYRNPDGGVCECCHPSVAVDEKGNVVVLFRNSVAGARDMYLTRSTDVGKTFDTAEKLGTGTWPLNACPMDGGDVAIDAEGEIRTIWMRDGLAFTAVAGGPEVKVGPGRQPVIRTTSGGAWLAWIDGGKLMHQWPERGAETLAEKANYPAAAVVRRRDVLAVWEAGSDVVVQSIPAP